MDKTHPIYDLDRAAGAAGRSYQRRGAPLVSPRKAARRDLLTLLARRAEQVATCSRPYRRVPWSEIRRACALARRRARREVLRFPRRREVRGRVPVWALDLALATRFGLGRRGVERGARGRLALLLLVGRELRRWGGGLRVEELSAILKLDETRVWRLLRWAAAEGALIDLGEKGWFLT